MARPVEPQTDHHPPTYQPHKSTTAAGARERTQGVAVMACRFNAKREKRKRNGENARKYRMKVRETTAGLIFIV